MNQSLLSATQALTQHKLKVATAESCTGGLISSALTSLAGSSAWFTCGLITYSNKSKEQLLAVDPKLLSQYGAVSSEVAIAMARGALKAAIQADISLAVTGIAGPDGGSVDKPVGTVWLAYTSRCQSNLCKRFFFPDEHREAIRSQICQTALEELSLFIATLV